MCPIGHNVNISLNIRNIGMKRHYSRKESKPDISKKQAYKLVGSVFAFVCVLSLTHVVYTMGTIQEASALEMIPLGNDRYLFADKEFHLESECGLMVVQYVLTPPYSMDKIAPYMKFKTDQCDADNPPNWTECPAWVKTDLGICDNIPS